jgi:hypothetical protein
MRALLTRQRVARSAVVAASVALVAACGVKQGSAPAPAGSVAAQAPYAAGTLLVSDGTATVLIGDKRVTFPTTVTEAAWSPDGSRIVFVDGDGNISSTNPDGAARVVLTSPPKGVVRSHPTWLGSQVVFAEKSSNGKSRLVSVWANGHKSDWAQGEFATGIGVEAPEQGNSAPSASAEQGPLGGTEELAFQHQGTKGPEVWVTDLNQREPWSAKVADGSEPALSPDGSKVAYVGRNGQIQVLATTGKSPKPVQVTAGAVPDPSHLTWSPDGKAIAFATSTDVKTVAVNVAAGATAAAPTQVSASPGVPTYLMPQREQVSRITGSDPVDTAVAASQSRWPTQTVAMATEDRQPANRAILAGTTDLPAVLAASQLVSVAHGPLLFTSGSALDPRTEAELKRTLGKVSADGYVPEVYLIGGVDAVSAEAERAVKKLGYQPVRISGKDRYELAVAAARAISTPSNATNVFVVSGDDTAAVAVASGQFGFGNVVLQTNGTTLPDSAKQYLNGLGGQAKVFALGAPAKDALAATWAGKPARLKATPLDGDPAAISAQLLDLYSGNVRRVVFVNQSALSDVVVGVSLARGYGGPALAIEAKGVGDPIRSWLVESSASVDTTYIVGPPSAIGVELESRIGGWLSGPLGYSSDSNPKFKP